MSFLSSSQPISSTYYFQKDCLFESKQEKKLNILGSAWQGAQRIISKFTRKFDPFKDSLPLLAQEINTIAISANIIPSSIKPTISEIITSTPHITRNFTQITKIEDQIVSHEIAKKFLTTYLKSLGATIEFINPPQKNVLELKDVTIANDLDQAVFSWEVTKGIQKDIQRDGQRKEDCIVIYGAASQFNGCEAPDKYTVPPGEAKETYQNDYTQGPQAQLQFCEEQVELINCAGNYGFNGLCKVLDEDTKNAIAHGYLTPIGKNVDQVISQLQLSGHKIEYSCIANKPIGGSKPIHLILVAAPAFGQYAVDKKLDKRKEEEVQFLCALHSFRAQFAQALKLADEHKKPVIFKPVAVGLGVFKNNPEVIAKAFYAAAKEVESDLLHSQVQVRYQVYNGTGEGRKMADYLQLQDY